jgi:hypothetical protein
VLSFISYVMLYEGFKIRGENGFEILNKILIRSFLPLNASRSFSSYPIICTHEGNDEQGNNAIYAAGSVGISGRKFHR